MNYTARCRHCDETSPVASRQAAKEWFGRHKQQCAECVARRSAAAASSRALDVELFAAKMADVRQRFQPIPLPVPTAGRGEWKDTATDAWGSRNKGLRVQWSGGQCLQACIASIIGCHVSKVPNPEASYDAEPEWHGHYSKRLEKATGYRLEYFPASICPPRQQANQLWIAGLDQGDEAHGVVARGDCVYHDPSRIYQGALPLHKLTAGFVLRPTRRDVPVFRGRHAIVPA